MALFAKDSVVTSAGLNLVSFMEEQDVTCPFMENLMNHGGFCKFVFGLLFFSNIRTYNISFILGLSFSVCGSKVIRPICVRDAQDSIVL